MFDGTFNRTFNRTFNETFNRTFDETFDGTINRTFDGMFDGMFDGTSRCCHQPHFCRPALERAYEHAGGEGEAGAKGAPASEAGPFGLPIGRRAGRWVLGGQPFRFSIVPPAPPSPTHRSVGRLLCMHACMHVHVGGRGGLRWRKLSPGAEITAEPTTHDALSSWAMRMQHMPSACLHTCCRLMSAHVEIPISNICE